MTGFLPFFRFTVYTLLRFIIIIVIKWACRAADHAPTDDSTSYRPAMSHRCLMGILDHHGVPSGHGADDVAARAFAVGIHMPRQAAPADHRQLKDMRRLPDQARHHRAGRPLVEYAILVTRAIHAQTVVVEEPLLELVQTDRIDHGRDAHAITPRIKTHHVFEIPGDRCRLQPHRKTHQEHTA